MTSDYDWDPIVLDNHISTGNTWIKYIESITPGNNKVFHQFGEYNQHKIATHKTHSDPIFFDANLFDTADLHFFDADTYGNIDHNGVILQCKEHVVSSAKKPVTIKVQPPNNSSLRYYFAWIPTKVQLTFKNTTQHTHATISTILNKHYKSPYPARNVYHMDEPVVTDTVYSDTPAIDDGSKSA